MRKKEEIVVYQNLALFYDFCEDCSKDLSFNKHLKRPFSTVLLINCAYLLLNIILIFFKINCLLTWILLFIYILIIAIYIKSKFFPKNKIKTYLHNLYPSFLKLLCTEKYSTLNSLTMLRELSYYIQNIKNKSPGTLKDKHPKICAIISSILSMIVSLIASPILLAILMILFIFLLIFKDLFDMIFVKDYDKLDTSIFLSCIEERRLEIIETSQKNIINKIKYALRLGKYR